MSKNYKKDDAKKKEWRVEFFGPPWEEIIPYAIEPFYSSDYAVKCLNELRENGYPDRWNLLQAHLSPSSRGWSDTRRYAYPKSIRQCLRIITHHNRWLDIVQFRLAHIEEEDNVIPYEILA